MRNNQAEEEISVVMMGATGAVGGEVVKTLLRTDQVSKITLLGRRPLESVRSAKAAHLTQRSIDIFKPESYASVLPGHQVAICTLGVGQPSKMSKEEFLRIDKHAVLDFAASCKKAGIQHFSLLASVGISASSSSFYLRSKGELVDAIEALGFERFSIFQPSMILTSENRYGAMQGFTLSVWPRLKPFLIGGLRKYRGIPVGVLGKAMAKNILLRKQGVEVLRWDDFYKRA